MIATPPELTSTASIVPLRRGQDGSSHSEETRTLALVLYATGGARSPAAVERLLPSYLTPMGLPVPAQQTIAAWAREDNWNARADDLWRAHPNMGFDELARLTIGTMLVLAKTIHEMATGLDTRSIEERVLSTAQYEKVMRVAKDVPRLTSYVPADAQVETDALPRDEREALARQALVQRNREGA